MGALIQGYLCWKESAQSKDGIFSPPPFPPSWNSYIPRDMTKAKQVSVYIKAELQFKNPIPLKSNKKIPSDTNVHWYPE